MSVVGVFVFGWGGVGGGWVGGGVGGMFPFVALARIMMLRNMMFLAREHIFTATQPDVSYTRRRVGATQQDVCGWGVCFWVGVGWVGCFRSLHLHASWCYATWCFLHENTSSRLRTMMFLTLEDMSVLRNRMSVGGVFVFGWGWGGWDVSVRCTCTHLDATQHDVSCTGNTSLLLRNMMFLTTTWEHLYIKGTLKRKTFWWRWPS